MSEDHAMTKVLVVDDEDSVRHFECQALESRGLLCRPASNAAEARACLVEHDIALALIDIRMPDESGMELVKVIRERHPNTSVVMVTGINDPLVAEAALEAGACGYLVKPFQANELIINVASALRRRSLEITSRDHREQLEQTVRERTGDLRQALQEVRNLEGNLQVSQEETILRLARACEFRDDDTGQHVQRMSRYAALMAKRLGFDRERCEQIRLASMLHDVGKIAIPDSILLKAGPLTQQETLLMQRHAEIGYHILKDSKSQLMQLASTIALTHHEKCDGSGYPHGFTSSTIPVEGRIAAIADVFDALTTKRVYKPAYSIERAVAIMRDGSGNHFDPHLLDLFLRSLDEVQAIKGRFRDLPGRANDGLPKGVAIGPLSISSANAGHATVVGSPHWN